jgi:hypothetical protein
MVMSVAAAIVSSRAVVADQPGCDSRGDEGLQCLVDRGQADVRHCLAHGCEDLLGGRVRADRAQVSEDGRSLSCEAPSSIFQCLS